MRSRCDLRGRYAVVASPVHDRYTTATRPLPRRYTAVTPTWQRLHAELLEVVGALAAQRPNALGHLEPVADGAADGLLHRGDEGGGRLAVWAKAWTGRDEGLRAID